jgi:hypothetical protein
MCRVAATESSPVRCSFDQCATDNDDADDTETDTA